MSEGTVLIMRLALCGETVPVCHDGHHLSARSISAWTSTTLRERGYGAGPVQVYYYYYKSVPTT